jgi:hypothetical protein
MKGDEPPLIANRMISAFNASQHSDLQFLIANVMRFL